MHRRSQYPAITAFCSHLLRCNRLERKGFRAWIFSPGMLFNSLEAWWKDACRRPKPHEGIDICIYRTAGGADVALPPATVIPPLYDGEIALISGDFLGQTVYVRHQLYDRRGRQLYSIYGHTQPHEGTGAGTRVREGTSFASLADASVKNPCMPAHLHLSVAWIPRALTKGMLSWETLGSSRIVLLDPLRLLSCPHIIVAAQRCKPASGRPVSL